MAGRVSHSLRSTGAGPAANPVGHDEPVVSRPGSWFDAWVAAAYGPTGFWRVATPAGHFRTASGTGPELAQALLALLDAHLEINRVLEVGAGDGALLAVLQLQRPSLALAAADLRSRPAGLPPAITWAQDLWDVRAGGWTTGEVDR